MPSTTSPRWSSTPTGRCRPPRPAPSPGPLERAELYALEAAQTTELLGVLAAARRDADAAEIAPASEPFTVEAPAGAPLSVTMLGRYGISAATDDIRTGLRSKAREVLAYFLLHPQGASLDEAVDALWPEAKPGQGSDWFWSAVGNLRTRLRAATGRDEIKIIDKIGGAFHLDSSLFDVDLWRFEAALAAATTATDAAAVEALEAATGAYGGDLCAGTYFAWVDGAREDLRRRAVDAAARLAELKVDGGDLEGAVLAVERAIAADPYAEDLYRRLMGLHA